VACYLLDALGSVFSAAALQDFLLDFGIVALGHERHGVDEFTVGLAALGTVDYVVVFVVPVIGSVVDKKLKDVLTHSTFEVLHLGRHEPNRLFEIRFLVNIFLFHPVVELGK
jgi:hypothetical protein